MADHEHGELRQDIRDIHTKIEARDERTHEKLDKILDNQSEDRLRVQAVETKAAATEKALIPVAKEVDRHKRFVIGFYAVIGVTGFSFGLVRFLQSIGAI